jgi:NAD(P)H-hydrate epimerase
MMRRPAVRAHRTLTLALPKTGMEALKGETFLADIGIPPSVYKKIGLNVTPFSGHRYWIPLTVVPSDRWPPNRKAAGS